MIAHSCPKAAAAIAFGLHRRTSAAWVTAAGEHAKQMPQHLVEQPRDPGQHPEGTRAAEIRVKAQGGV